MRNPEVVLRMDDVSFSYAGGRAGAGVSHVSLEARAGELVLLCGESGCGKTTVARLANGLAPRFYEGELAGSVHVCGIDVSRAELWETARFVGSVFQNPKSQFYSVDVRGEVAFGCENLGFDPGLVKRRVDEAVRDFELGPLLGKSLFALSGGQKQRVACASATATAPALVVLDEPSSNLDFETMAHLRAAIERWKARGAAVLVAEHRLHYLEGLVDQACCLRRGSIEHRWTGEEFSRLPAAERERLGLRARTVDEAFAVPCGHARGEAPAGADREPAGPRTVRAEGLSAEYRVDGRLRRALDVPELELPPGSVLALVGACGAGKSTFAEALVGLNRCRGSLVVDGRRLGKRARAKACFMVMQDVNHQLFADSVLDEVLLGAREDGAARKRALGILERLDLAEFADDHPLSLSGGQRQRVAIATAVATGRDLVVYDEPTSGLDLARMRSVAATVRTLQDRGIRQVVITHDPEFVLSCCTHVAAMEGGRIIASGPLDESTLPQLAAFFRGGEHAREGAFG